MPFDLQPTLSGDLVELRPLRPDDFDTLFAVASDPLIWEQHPERDRYREERFRVYFQSGLDCGGALLALDAKTGAVIGSSRYFGYDLAASEIEIGWTFLARSHWGGAHNREMKRLMLQHAFRFVENVVFLIGADNLRSRNAVEKIGAVYIGTRIDTKREERVVYRITAASMAGDWTLAHMPEIPDYVLQNRAHWDEMAKSYADSAERHWADDRPSWGIWGIPESEVRMIPSDIRGKDVIELGCGTAYVAAWLARAGARVVGIDNSEAQLATARRMQQEHDLDFPLLHGNAETVPYPDASFDFAISEYGACLWADPYKWVPEAARVLRPGGRLHFLTNGHVLTLCAPPLETDTATDRLHRPAFGLHRLEWPDDTGVEFHLTHGNWIRLFRENGLEIEELLELRPPEGATTRYPYVTAEWARQWPSEEVWKVRKRG